MYAAFVTVSSSTIFSVTYGFNSGQIVRSFSTVTLLWCPFKLPVGSRPVLHWQGLTNVGTIVGVVLALVTTGPLNDWWVVWMARRNGGVYEPEFRLVFMLSMLFGMFGYVGWAIGNDRHMPWIGAVACLAYVPSRPSLAMILSLFPLPLPLQSLRRLSSSHRRPPVLVPTARTPDL